MDISSLWHEYWWAITTVILIIHINFIGWEARSLRTLKRIELNKELRRIYEIDDDLERVRARAKIKSINNSLFDKKDAIAAINSLPWLLHIIIFLLIAIYMKLPE